MGKLELHTVEVHIWKLRWRELETFWNRYKPILEKEECQKAKHYRFHEDKMRYLAGKIAVRMFLKEYSGEPWTSIPYGRPLANQLLRVVNNKGKDSPVGVPGELWIGGYGVAEGYVNEEKLTQERFVKIDGIRWYKTGDKAQYFQDGNVQFLGRLDDQVKVNGYRIELGEIENVIKRAECIDDAIAMTVETNGKKEIVAAVVEKYEKGNASHQVFMNEENPEYAEIQEIRKKVVAAFILKVYGNNVDSLTPNDNIVINSNGKVEQYWNVWLLINNVISHKDSDEYVLNLEIKNVLSDIWYMKLETQIPMVQELIRGTVSASNLLTNGYLSPEELLVQGSDTVIFLEHVTKVIKHDSKVAVLGARTGLAVEMLLNNNLDRNVELTLIDESAGMLKRAEERLRRYDVQFEYYHFEDGLLEKSLLGQFDFVIALGELHRYKNPLHWPLFDVKNICIDTCENFLLVDIEMIIVDGMSLQLILKDFWDIYSNSKFDVQEIDYLKCAKSVRETRDKRKYEIDKEYWMQRLPLIPNAPKLPECKIWDESNICSRLQRKIEKEEWAALEKMAKDSGVTVSITLVRI